ncbi:MAG: hypothetical protein KGK11_10520 [Sphingomonadales bacterium]|nr:hypothetical protein [Sphingomonadales bacterium]
MTLADISAEAEAAFGPVYILLNNAAITIQGAQRAEIGPEFFDRITVAMRHVDL